MFVDNDNASDVHSAPTDDVTDFSHQPADQVIEGDDDQVSTQPPAKRSFLDLAAKAKASIYAGDSDTSEDDTDLDAAADDLPDGDPDPDALPTEDKTEDLKDPEPKGNRASRFREMTEQHAQATAQLAELNTKLEKFGGVEGFEHVGGIIDAFMDPDGKFSVPGEKEGEMREVTGKDMIFDFVNDLPGKESVFSDFFLKGLANPENQIFAFNDILQGEDFGLREDLSLNQEQFAVVGKYLAAKLNGAKNQADVDSVFKNLNFEIEQLGYDAGEYSKDRELEKLRQENAALKNPPANPNQPATAENNDPVQTFVKQYQEELEKEQKSFQAQDDLIIKLYDTVGSELLTKAGWAADKGDSETAIAAKQKFADLLLGRTNIAQMIRGTDAFKKAAGYISNGTLETSRTGQIAASDTA
jgi:hypothetical protein